MPSSVQEPADGLPIAEAVRVISSQRLMDGARELRIEHAGSEYRLRVTRNDKLILTK